MNKEPFRNSLIFAIIGFLLFCFAGIICGMFSGLDLVSSEIVGLEAGLMVGLIGLISGIIGVAS